MCAVHFDTLCNVCVFGMCRDTNLLEDQDLIGFLQVLQLVGDQDPGLVLQQATDAPDSWTQRKDDGLRFI